MTAPRITLDGSVITIHIPIRLKRHGGRKLVVAPEGGSALPVAPPAPDDTLIRALVQAHKWQKMLDGKRFSSVEEMARQQHINPSYLSRVMRLSLLAPDIRGTILDGRQPKGLRLIDMLKPFPDLWEEQRKWFGFRPAEE